MSFEDAQPRLTSESLATMRATISHDDLMTAQHLVDKAALLEEVVTLRRMVMFRDNIIVRAGGLLALAKMAEANVGLESGVVPPTEELEQNLRRLEEEVQSLVSTFRRLSAAAAGQRAWQPSEPAIEPAPAGG